MSVPADVVSELHLLDVSVEPPADTESLEGKPLNGHTPKVLSMASILAGFRSELNQIMGMADQLSGQIEEIRATAREANNRLKQLEVDLALLESEDY